jgi:hypothetical protein
LAAIGKVKWVGLVGMLFIGENERNVITGIIPAVEPRILQIHG